MVAIKGKGGATLIKPPYSIAEQVELQREQAAYQGGISASAMRKLAAQGGHLTVNYPKQEVTKRKRKPQATASEV